MCYKIKGNTILEKWDDENVNYSIPFTNTYKKTG